MTTYAERPTIAPAPGVAPVSKGRLLVKWITTRQLAISI